MDSPPPFQLEPVSPADRAAQAETNRKRAREAVQKARKRAAQQGLKQIAITVPGEQIAALDEFQRQAGLVNRSAAMERVLGAGLAVIRPESMAVIERVQEAKGLADASQAIEAIIALARDPKFQQELGL